MLKPTFTVLLSVLFFLACTYTPVGAQSPQIDSSVSYLFGETITFQALVHSGRPIKQATIFFQAQNDTRTNLGEAEVTQKNNESYQLSYLHQLAFYAIRPFAQVEFRWEILFEDGETYKSPKFSFFYRDNRFEWQELGEAPIQVFWYQGDRTFAQSILDTAHEGLNQLRHNLLLDAPDQLDIYVYHDTSTLLQALNPAGPGWISGHADPDLGVILVSISEGTGQRQDIEQRIPHELAHIALYQAAGPGYNNIPTWFNEGLASLVEIHPNQDYQVLLDHAIETDSLLPIQSLCSGFPRDASNALLAYAQAASFTRFIYEGYGATKIDELIDTYANGISCENGVKTVLGQSLTQLENRWHRESLKQNTALKAFQNLLPWLVALLLTLGAPIVLAIYRLRSTSS